jgi:hypothetical protein
MPFHESTRNLDILFLFSRAEPFAMLDAEDLLSVIRSRDLQHMNCRPRTKIACIHHEAPEPEADMLKSCFPLALQPLEAASIRADANQSAWKIALVN